MKTFKVEKSQKLSSFLLENYNGELTYNSLMKVLRNKDIKINNKRTNKDVFLNAGDEIIVYYDGKPNIEELSVVFECSDLIVINKKQGITCEDLLTRVKLKYPNSRPVHRLDRNTCGLVIFALNEDSESELLKVFKNGSIDKYYLCLWLYV